jgi:hypothetical protein
MKMNLMAEAVERLLLALLYALLLAWTARALADYLGRRERHRQLLIWEDAVERSRESADLSPDEINATCCWLFAPYS